MNAGGGGEGKLLKRQQDSQGEKVARDVQGNKCVYIEERERETDQNEDEADQERNESCKKRNTSCEKNVKKQRMTKSRKRRQILSREEDETSSPTPGFSFLYSLSTLVFKTSSPEDFLFYSDLTFKGGQERHSIISDMTLQRTSTSSCTS
jgi:hypothetical protein